LPRQLPYQRRTRFGAELRGNLRRPQGQRQAPTRHPRKRAGVFTQPGSKAPQAVMVRAYSITERFA